MRRQLLTIPAVAIAFLSGCASASNDAVGNDTITAVQDSPTTNASDGEVGRLNQPYEISTLADNDVYLTITDLRVGGECEYGSLDAGEYDNISGENTLLQVWAELDVQKLDNPQSGGEVMLMNPTIVDGNGFTQDAEFAMSCQGPTEPGIDDWYISRGPGEKSRLYGMFAVPADLKQVKIEGATFDVAPATATS